MHFLLVFVKKNVLSNMLNNDFTIYNEYNLNVLFIHTFVLIYYEFYFRKCALMELPLLCLYRMNLGGADEEWYCISQICRNRVSFVFIFFKHFKLNKIF